MFTHFMVDDNQPGGLHMPKQISTTLTDEQLALFDAAALKQNLSRSNFLRRLILSAINDTAKSIVDDLSSIEISTPINENQPSFTQSSIDDLYRLLDQSIIDDKSTKNNLSNLIEQVIEQLKEFNNKSSKILATLIDDKSSKIPEIKQPTDLLIAAPIDDTWEEENSQEDCAQYVDKDGNLLTPEEYQKLQEEHDKYMEEFELQRKLEKQAHEIELRNQIKPMPHYTHLETYKDENSVIYQETYKQYQLRYNSIRTANLQNTFELLNYMAPVLKTEKIYREFLEKIDAAESSNDKHLWQRAGGYNNYNLQKHLESLAAAQAQYPTYQKLNLPNFIPYTIQEEKTSKKAIVWDV